MKVKILKSAYFLIAIGTIGEGKKVSGGYEVTFKNVSQDVIPGQSQPARDATYWFRENEVEEVKENETPSN